MKWITMKWAIGRSRARHSRDRIKCFDVWIPIVPPHLAEDSVLIRAHRFVHPQCSRAHIAGFLHIFLFCLHVCLPPTPLPTGNPTAFCLGKGPWSPARDWMSPLTHGWASPPLRALLSLLSLIREQMDCLLLKAVGSTGRIRASISNLRAALETIHAQLLIFQMKDRGLRR